MEFGLYRIIQLASSYSELVADQVSDLSQTGSSYLNMSR